MGAGWRPTKQPRFGHPLISSLGSAACHLVCASNTLSTCRKLSSTSLLSYKPTYFDRVSLMVQSSYADKSQDDSSYFSIEDVVACSKFNHQSPMLCPTQEHSGPSSTPAARIPTNPAYPSSPQRRARKSSHPLPPSRGASPLSRPSRPRGTRQRPRPPACRQSAARRTRACASP